MGSKVDTDYTKIKEIKKGEPFVQLTRGLIASDAWQSMSINERRIMDFLMIEHMNHAGLENGGLLATYKQLESFGVYRISKAITDLEQKGLVNVERGFRKSLNDSYPNRFEVTFLKGKYKENGGIYYAAPSHGWKKWKKNSC